MMKGWLCRDQNKFSPRGFGKKISGGVQSNGGWGKAPESDAPMPQARRVGPGHRSADGLRHSRYQVMLF